MLPPCYKCGTVYDGDRCPRCCARVDGIKRAFYVYMGGLTVGFCGLLFAGVTYPPLEPRYFDAYLLPILIVIPAAMMIVLAVCDQTEQFAVLAGLVFVLARAALPSRAAVIFLNGALERNPPVEVQTSVSGRSVESDENGTHYVLDASVPWDQRQIETHLGVSRDVYSFAKTGDSLRLAIYPGALNRPWYGQAVVSDGHREIRFSPR